jgi:hypothetical protein
MDAKIINTVAHAKIAVWLIKLMNVIMASQWGKMIGKKFVIVRNRDDLRIYFSLRDIILCVLHIISNSLYYGYYVGSNLQDTR